MGRRTHKGRPDPTEGGPELPRHLTAIAGQRIALGAITRPHGIRGEVRVHLFNEDSNLLLEQRVLYLGLEASEPNAVESIRRMPKGALLKLRGVDDRDGAEALRDVELCVERDALPDPDPDEVYLADLVGLEVATLDGEIVGEVVDIMNYPSVDCLRVRVEEGYREVPIIEPWIVEIDLDGGLIVVESIEELALERG